MKSGASQSQAVREPAAINSERVQFPSAPEADGQFTENSRLWALLERLRGSNPSNGADALRQVEPLLQLANSNEGQSIIVKALSLEDPPHFAFAEVRVAAFRALTPGLPEISVACVMLQEIENFKRPDVCREAIDILSNCPPIRDRDFTSRVVNLLRDTTTSDEHRNALEQFSPRLELPPDRATVTEMIKLAEENYKERSGVNPGLYNALALTNSPRAIEFLKDVVYERFKRPYHYSFHKNAELSGFLSLFGWALGVGGLLVGAAESGNLLVGLGILCACVAPRYLYPLYGIFSSTRDIHNSSAVRTAARALRLVTEDNTGARVLRDISKDKDLPEESRAEIVAALEDVRLGFEPKHLMEGLKHSSPKVRLSALRSISQLHDTDIIPYAMLASRDSSMEVRKLAFTLLDQMANERSQS